MFQHVGEINSPGELSDPETKRRELKMSAQFQSIRLSQIGGRPCPGAGGGVHRWIYAASCRCRDAGLSQEDAILLIERELTRSPSPTGEVKQGVRAAYCSSPGGRVARWPDQDRDEIRRLVAQGQGCETLREISPVISPDQSEVLASLFKIGDLVCTGGTVGSPLVWEMKAGAKVPGKPQFIVPNPMTAKFGRTQEGKLSPRTFSNTGRRRWIVVECDFAKEEVESFSAESTFEVCASVLLHLAEFRPLVLVVHSGGKSLHGWFPVNPEESENEEKSKLWRFMAFAVSLGACPSTWTKSQWVRCPGGTRRGAGGESIKQEVIYFNPETAKRFLK